MWWCRQFNNTKCCFDIITRTSWAGPWWIQKRRPNCWWLQDELQGAKTHRLRERRFKTSFKRTKQLFCSLGKSQWLLEIMRWCQPKSPVVELLRTKDVHLCSAWSRQFSACMWMKSVKVIGVATERWRGDLACFEVKCQCHRTGTLPSHCASALSAMTTPANSSLASWKCTCSAQALLSYFMSPLID